MVRSLRATVPSMEELSRRTGIHVNPLWRAFNNPGAKINGMRDALEAYFNQQFPDIHFSEFVAIHDEKLQDAFQLAVEPPQNGTAGQLRNSTELRLLFKENWAWVSGWDFKGDKAASMYLRARFMLTAGWTNVQLDSQLKNQLVTLKAASTEADACAQELDRQPERPHLPHLKMKVTKLKISAQQRLHLYEHKKHLPVTNTIPRPELENFLQYLLSGGGKGPQFETNQDMQISRIRLSDKTSRLHPRHAVRKPGQAYEPEVPVKVREWIGPALASPDSQISDWPKGHFNRWQFSRDAVTISSGLSLLNECSKAYAILLDERPEFEDIDHAEWTVGPAANDPDLQFFRNNINQIRNIIKPTPINDNEKESDMLKLRKIAMGLIAITLLAAAVAGQLIYKAPAEKAGAVASIVWPNRVDDVKIGLNAGQAVKTAQLS
jgi:hypothetical protein